MLVFMTSSTVEKGPPADDRAARYPLHVTLATIFVTAFALFGMAVIAYSYLEGRRMELVGAHDLMDRIGRQIQAEITVVFTVPHCIELFECIDADIETVPSPDGIGLCLVQRGKGCNDSDPFGLQMIHQGLPLFIKGGQIGS